MTLNEKKQEVMNTIIDEYVTDDNYDIHSDLDIKVFNPYDEEELKNILNECNKMKDVKYYHHKIKYLRIGWYATINDSNIDKISFDHYAILVDVLYNIIKCSYKDCNAGIMIRSKKYDAGYVLFEGGLSLYAFVNSMINTLINKLYAKSYTHLKNISYDVIENNQGIFRRPNRYSKEILTNIFEKSLKDECSIEIFKNLVDNTTKEFLDLMFDVNTKFSFPLRWMRKLAMIGPYIMRLKFIFGWSLASYIDDYNVIMKMYKDKMKPVSSMLGYE